MSDLIDKVKTFYAELSSDPVAACEEFLSGEFVLENFLPEQIPFGGRYEGAEGLLRYLGEIFAAIEMEPLEMDEWVADSRTVAVRGEDKGLVRSNGRRYRMRFVHWLTFDETGHIAFMREFNDTAALAGAFDR
jgi:ketosteroid isomerase-like protein